MTEPRTLDRAFWARVTKRQAAILPCLPASMDRSPIPASLALALRGICPTLADLHERIRELADCDPNQIDRASLMTAALDCFDRGRIGPLAFDNDSADTLNRTLSIPHAAGLLLPHRGVTTLAILAVACEHPVALANLLAAGARPDDRDSKGWTPLCWAAFADDLPAVQLLLAHGADPFPPSVDGLSIEDLGSHEPAFLEVLTAARTEHRMRQAVGGHDARPRPGIGL